MIKIKTQFNYQRSPKYHLSPSDEQLRLDIYIYILNILTYRRISLHIVVTHFLLDPFKGRNLLWSFCLL